MNIKDLLKPEFEVHIVCNERENYTKASGTTPNLLTALSVFVKALKENKIDEGAINYAVEQGLKDEKDVDKELEKNLDELIKKLLS